MLVVAGGITLHEAIKAREKLLTEGINIRILDIFSIKPIDQTGILQNAIESNSTVLTVEDHYIHGGIKGFYSFFLNFVLILVILLDSVASCLGEFEKIKVFGLGINEIPKSGQSKDLLAMYGIDANAIVKKVKEIIQSQD